MTDITDAYKKLSGKNKDAETTRLNLEIAARDRALLNWIVYRQGGNCPECKYKYRLVGDTCSSKECLEGMIAYAKQRLS